MKKILFRIKALFTKGKLDAEMDEEMRSHIDLRTQENIASGMTAEEARVAALQEFGSSESIKESCRDQRGTSWIENIAQDLRFGIRQLCKNPGFTATALLTLALGIGANLTIFAVIDAVLLRPLPFPHADRLVTTIHSYPLSGVPRSSASLPNYYDYREHIKAFSSVAIIHTDYSGPTIVGGPVSPYRVDCDRVSPEFFSTLEVPLLMGRTFSENEMTYAGSHVAVLTFSFWRSYFNADPNVLGRKFDVDTLSTTVIGVLPPGFSFLSSHAQFYTPAASDPWERAPDQRHNNRCQLIARLAPRATIGMAREQIAALDAEQLKDDPYSESLKQWGFSTIVDPLRQDHVRKIRPTLLLLECGAVLLLVGAAVNLVNLLLIRASGRSKELAVRQSLGANKWRVANQVVTETVLLALLGGLAGLAVAAGGIRLLAALGADQLPLGSYISFDKRLCLAALLGAIVIGVLVAFPIARFNLCGDFARSLLSETRTATGHRAAQNLRHSFIVTQIALAFVLLTSAAMLKTSLKRILDTSPGFQTEQIFTGQITLPYNNYENKEARLRFIQRLVALIQSQPGVNSVGVGCLMPFAGKDSSGITAIEGAQNDSQHVAYRNGVVGDYWRVLSIPLIEGRQLEDADNDRKQLVCVVDQAFARRYWPGKSPLGHRLNDGPVFKSDEAFTIVGVVGTVKQRDLTDNAPLGTVYYPYKYWPDSAFTVAVRSALTPEALAPILRKAVSQIDPQLPIDSLKSMKGRIDESLIARRSPALLAGIFAGVALLITAIGTYGVLAYAVAQRRREIGVRIALGALPKQIAWQFLALGLRLVALGTVLGVLGALAAGHAMRSILFNMPLLDVATFASGAIILTIVSLVACLVPTLRACCVDPMKALRHE